MSPESLKLYSAVFTVETAWKIVEVNTLSESKRGLLLLCLSVACFKAQLSLWHQKPRVNNIM